MVEGKSEDACMRRMDIHDIHDEDCWHQVFAIKVLMYSRVVQNLTYGDMIYIKMPRFTTSTLKQGVDGGSNGANIPMDQVELAPSMYWKGSWTEGTWCAGCEDPFADSMLSLQVMRINGNLTWRDLHTVTVFKSNNIKAFCGQAMNSNKLRIGTNSSGSTVWMDIETSPLVGNGCQDKSSCNLHGTCDYCYNTCTCDMGYGHPSEIYEYVKIDCGDRVCPSGRAIRDLPTSHEHAHPLAECSNNGICERQVAQCVCFPGWEGIACERRTCPNSCSGHGICASMREQALMSNAFPLTNNATQYGATDLTRNGSAWDYEYLFSCVCDSSWPVGLERGEWQKAEYFGPDCSLRRCPHGDDPITAVNETDCNGVVAEGGAGTGKPGNGCYAECSNRGTCIYQEGVGKCKCFDGFLGENCGTLSEYGMEMGEWVDPQWSE